MPQQLDRRTRTDASRRFLAPAEFFMDAFPRLAAKNGGMVAQAMTALGAHPLTLDVDGESWSIELVNGSVRASATAADGALRLQLTAEQFSDWAQNQISFHGMLVGRRLRCEPENLFQISLWDSLALTLLEGWPAVTEGLAFSDRDGQPLDLAQSFTPEADPADIAHFLREVGFLHLKGWLDAPDMVAISDEMDRARPDYVEGDGKSWWATLSDGSRACVRLQEFVERSPTTAKILKGDTWERMIRILEGSDSLARKPVEGRIIEALFKPVGVASGPSDLSFHRDCHLGRHSYACARMTVGIAITPASESNGLLKVIAGSHRVVMPVEIAKSAPYLPVIELATEPGDLTVHLSCTLHAATAPVSTERRVLYTEIPQRQADGRFIDTSVNDVREQVNDIMRGREVAR